MELRRSDDRKAHLVTRGNVDGIISAALMLARDPGTRVSFVPSGELAVDVLRRDISSRRFFLVDLGLTPRLIKTLNDKGKGGSRVCYLDHHQHSIDEWDQLDPRIEGVVRQGVSGAGVAYSHLRLNGRHRHLVAIADHVEFCPSPLLRDVAQEFGMGRVEEEARIMDYSWRCRVDDDRFRLTAARRLAAGRWPSEVDEIMVRYRQMQSENRWERSLERVRDRVELKHGVALLRFGRRKPSLFGFGSRALAAVAREMGAEVAVLLNRRSNQSSISLRRTGTAPGFSLGRFAAQFTARHGVVGGGHAHSAGARIPTKAIPRFLHEIYCLA